MDEIIQQRLEALEALHSELCRATVTLYHGIVKLAREVGASPDEAHAEALGCLRTTFSVGLEEIARLSAQELAAPNN